jgi:hypothetical protein
MNAPNPFAPPSADLSPHPESRAAARKPYSVWVVQVVGGVIAAWCTLGLVLITRLAIMGQRTSAFGMPIWLHLFLQACLAVLLYVMLWHLPKRARLARNLGLGLIALLAIPTGIITYYTPSDSSQPAASWIVTLIFVAPFAYWAFAFAFSSKARRYFAAATAYD